MRFDKPIFALDIETSTSDPKYPYALECFRVKQQRAKIDSIAVSGPDNYAVNLNDPSSEDLKELIYSLKGKIVYCHNTVFDVSWLLAYVSFDVCEKVKWMDTGLLAKWLLNSQKTKYGDGDKGKFSFSLKNLVDVFLPKDDKVLEFLGMKDRGEGLVAGEDRDYWFERGMQDAIMTRKLAMILLDKLPDEQYNGFYIEQQCIIYVARADLNGIHVDSTYIESLGPKIKTALKKLSLKMDIDLSVIKSPKQLSNYLFNVCGYKGINKTKTGWSTAAGDLLMIAINNPGPEGDPIRTILDIKQLQTLENKYLNGFIRSMDYNKESKVYPSARIFGTYTGRFTYASKTLNKNIFQKSIAIHQLPRVGPTKKCLLAPENKWILRCDGAQQELRLVGLMSEDPNLLKEFNDNIDVHSSMSAFIAGESYKEFVDKLKKKDPKTINYRFAGKLLNLSCQYRIGATALKRKFFETYEIIISYPQAKSYLDMYKRRYSGVVEYWKSTVLKSRVSGYASTLADRRYYLSQWDSNKWATESSAINEPIQGSAADHKELTLLLMSKKYPEIQFFLDIHDELCFYVPKDIELVSDVANTIANLGPIYNKMWDTELPLELPFDTLLCKENFKEGIEIQ